MASKFLTAIWRCQYVLNVFRFLSELVLCFATERIKQTSKECQLGASCCAKHWGTIIIRLVSHSCRTQTNRAGHNLLTFLLKPKALTSTVWINSLLSEFLLVHSFIHYIHLRANETLWLLLTYSSLPRPLANVAPCLVASIPTKQIQQSYLI